jgi:hypothetical protein
MPVPSPCINVCTIDEGTGFCKGCFRTIEEVAAWPSLSDAAKLAIIVALKQRRSAQ